MASLTETTAALRFSGDDLDPDSISALLGTSPTTSAKKGEVSVNKRGVKRTARTGLWLLEVDRRLPGDLDAQIVELFAPLTTDTSVWRKLATQFSGDIYCGLFMKETNEGLELKPETLVMIGSRGLLLGLEIYSPLTKQGVEKEEM